MTTIRDLVGQPQAIVAPRTEAEERATAVMPGDDPTDHPLYTLPNPYLMRPRSELLGLVKGEELPPEEERLVRAALHMQELSHQGGVQRIR